MRCVNALFDHVLHNYTDFIKTLKLKIQSNSAGELIQSLYKTIYCDFRKFREKTGWQPKIPLATTLSDTIEYERQKLKWPKSAF